MVVNHFILIKLKPEATETQIKDMANAIRGMKDVIPGIISLECGKNFTNRSDFHFGLLVSDISTPNLIVRSFLQTKRH